MEGFLTATLHAPGQAPHLAGAAILRGRARLPVDLLLLPQVADPLSGGGVWVKVGLVVTSDLLDHHLAHCGTQGSCIGCSNGVCHLGAPLRSAGQTATANTRQEELWECKNLLRTLVGNWDRGCSWCKEAAADGLLAAADGKQTCHAGGYLADWLAAFKRWRSSHQEHRMRFAHTRLQTYPMSSQAAHRGHVRAHASRGWRMQLLLWVSANPFQAASLCLAHTTKAATGATSPRPLSPVVLPLSSLGAHLGIAKERVAGAAGWDAPRVAQRERHLDERGQDC